MLQTATDLRTLPIRASNDLNVDVIGAGVAGTWQALMLAKAGCRVTVYERDTAALTTATSHVAGGMLAPWCEAESSEPVIVRLGVRALDLWREELPDVPFNGSLVVAHPRDRADFERFARLTDHHRRLDADGVNDLEPSLDGRFREALFFPDEGHVEPRRVLPQLHARLTAMGVTIRFETERTDSVADLTIDCRGLAARDIAPDLRGVKGEMILVETDEVHLSRPVRFLHPRWPLYVIPRDNNRFMIGATSIESEDRGVSVRSALELLSAAYAVHPAFGEARIIEVNAGLRPAFPDNLPRIDVRNDTIAVNGLYRHGFLLAPALAELTAAYVARGEIDNEVMRCS
ncbi:glycine oxidase ThiO [Bradyrhizobium sp. U87765 SZCCT0131]|uniref:glycine oxidase ThiO n=1 Tax=unclassified Bradyrhizobium TaxID=2631580 RepID=UPI001BADE67E|nr:MULTISPECIES: glycine oxidase ThiO [unclassified Bradyrhizobium]MBR1218416.1 glycine oxidase ThiO [Bradyrhizobium sp. U87765 SZCCT0131]MBR1260638.1 glycine oxidase ThiO [Bradyrhizobium sp. U87765 SZCCT0134]MBR1303914.1 glycine oxidase ThiO [Bradyrhizobium sp. U87765 SZCCT0110]MBR1319520.1 glycine oxidase ThiO [Bradyrhizobium sp. U87765 SZCCT0109]MBR1347845.1 glycine oxidase ThiO [Bradyrhizobium sp. U87765 SZCCT0048]